MAPAGPIPHEGGTSQPEKVAPLVVFLLPDFAVELGCEHLCMDHFLKFSRRKVFQLREAPR